MNNQTLMLEQSTYYILDAQGNQLNIYEHSVDSVSGSVYYYLTDRNIYGSSRIGVTKDTLNMFNPSVLQSYGILGNRNYELTDHRGNVQTVINDIKYPLSSDNTTIDSYEVGINSIADYSPFGVQLDGRTIENVFYYPENGNSPQTPADTVEIYNNDFENPPATGSPYLSTEVTLDAHLSNTNWTSSTGAFTNYNSSGAGSGKSIAIGTASADTAYLTLTMDVDSGYELDITSYSFAHRSSATGYDSYTLIVNGIEIGSGNIYVASSGSTLQSTGVVDVSNPISGQTGTVGVVLKLYGGTHGHSGTFRMDDFVLIGFVREENSGYFSSDYFVSRNHRYSFQNQEKHDEIRGKGNYINYKYRGYDPRVGRLDWLIDPLAPQYPHNSPYAFSENRVLDGVELEGLEFLDKDDALFKMIGGELYLKVENAGHWTKKGLENKIPASRTANGHNQIGAYPLSNSPVVSVENPLAPKSLVGPNGRKSSQMTTEQNLAAQQPNNRQTRRQNARSSFTPYPSGTRSGAKGIIALNIIIEGVEKWREYSLKFDNDELNSQFQNYFDRTNIMLRDASRDGLIPLEYYNTDDYSKLFNVILYGGEENYGSDEIRALGIFIYEKYTNNSGIYLDLIPESVKNNVGNDTENK